MARYTEERRQAVVAKLLPPQSLKPKAPLLDPYGAQFWVAPPTQNQAMNSMVFLCKPVLDVDFGDKGRNLWPEGQA